MNNILFCTTLIDSGSIADSFASPDSGLLGIYDLETLDITTSSLAGKDFGLIGSTIGVNGSPGVLNIGDIHPLKIVSSTLPLNVSYSIVIAAASEEPSDNEEENDIDSNTPPAEEDVELFIIHRNADPSTHWRNIITIPYPDFDGDTSTLMGIINDKIEQLVEYGNLELASSIYNDGTLTLYFSNSDQYIITSKSKYLTITGPSGYLPLTTNDLVKLIDKNAASFGIEHREYDNYWYRTVAQYIQSNDAAYDSVISIRYTAPRKSGVTHDELIYQTLHILTTEDNVSAIMAIISNEE